MHILPFLKEIGPAFIHMRYQSHLYYLSNNEKP
jgi:hypothetical protein